MLDKSELGRRIKGIRESKHLTLKNIEASAGISATHISEIERGKTSPTLGALIRIAKALGKDPAYFVEEDELKDVSVVTLESRIKEKLQGGTGTMERLTTSIPAGKIQATVITLAPGKSPRSEMHSHYGNEAALVVSGKFLFKVADERFELSEGDSIYYSAQQEHAYENGSNKEEAQMVWISTERNYD